MLDRDEIKKRLEGVPLPLVPDNCLYIIKAKEAFKLCYRLSSNPSHIIFPDKLASEQPGNLGFDKNKPGTLMLEFQFISFLPRHVMPMFSVENHQNIKNGLVWQNGAIFQIKDHRVVDLCEPGIFRRDHSNAYVEVLF